MRKIKLFEEFAAAGAGEGEILLVKLIDNAGLVLDKKGTSIEEQGVTDEEGISTYMGGVSEDGILIGAYGGFLMEGSPLAKQYPHLAANCAMNEQEELFDFAAGDKYKGQMQFKKIGKFVH